MKAALAGQQFPGPEDLLTGIHEFLSEIQRSELELVLHHWIERVQWVLDNDGDCFHEETFYDHHSFQFCHDRPVTTIDRLPYTKRLTSQIHSDVQFIESLENLGVAACSLVRHMVHQADWPNLASRTTTMPFLIKTAIKSHYKSFGYNILNKHGRNWRNDPIGIDCSLLKSYPSDGNFSIDHFDRYLPN
jgi:hypothetical protein